MANICTIQKMKMLEIFKPRFALRATAGSNRRSRSLHLLTLVDRSFKLQILQSFWTESNEILWVRSSDHSEGSNGAFFDFAPMGRLRPIFLCFVKTSKSSKSSMFANQFERNFLGNIRHTFPNALTQEPDFWFFPPMGPYGPKTAHFLLFIA